MAKLNDAVVLPHSGIYESLERVVGVTEDGRAMVHNLYRNLEESSHVEVEKRPGEFPCVGHFELRKYRWRPAKWVFVPKEAP